VPLDYQRADRFVVWQMHLQALDVPIDRPDEPHVLRQPMHRANAAARQAAHPLAVHRPTCFPSRLSEQPPGPVDVRSHDGLQLAVTITCATDRTRLLRYVPHTREWVGSF
jgi:hypothetical protein